MYSGRATDVSYKFERKSVENAPKSWYNARKFHNNARKFHNNAPKFTGYIGSRVDDALQGDVFTHRKKRK